MLTLGPSISTSLYMELLNQLKVLPTPYTAYPTSIKVQHRGLDVIITRLKHEAYHTANESLRLLQKYRSLNRSNDPPNITFIEPKSMKSTTSYAVWESIERGSVSKPDLVSRIGYDACEIDESQKCNIM
jgi:hypothetical protein